MTIKLVVAVKGSSRSGNWGHAGRPGRVGGSRSVSATATAAAANEKIQPPTQAEVDESEVARQWLDDSMGKLDRSLNANGLRNAEITNRDWDGLTLSVDVEGSYSTMRSYQSLAGKVNKAADAAGFKISNADGDGQTAVFTLEREMK